MSSFFQPLKKVIIRSAALGASLALFQEYIGGFVISNGPSMEPTIFTNDIILTEQMSPRLGMLSKGDIVIAKSPESIQYICKRIVGVPGDIVKYKGQRVEIKEEHFWLEGDNKKNSYDSRDWGPLHSNKIRRKCIVKIWPNIELKFGKSENMRVYAEASQDL